MKFWTSWWFCKSSLPVVHIKMFMVTLPTVFQTILGQSTVSEISRRWLFLTTFQLGACNHHLSGITVIASTLVLLPYTSFSQQSSQSDKIKQSQLCNSSAQRIKEVLLLLRMIFTFQKAWWSLWPWLSSSLSFIPLHSCPKTFFLFCEHIKHFFFLQIFVVILLKHFHLWPALSFQVFAQMSYFEWGLPWLSYLKLLPFSYPNISFPFF